MSNLAQALRRDLTAIEFGYGAETSWPLTVSFHGQIYGEEALNMWYQENYGRAPHFRTVNAAQKWVDKAYRRWKLANRK